MHIFSILGLLSILVSPLNAAQIFKSNNPSALPHYIIKLKGTTTRSDFFTKMTKVYGVSLRSNVIYYYDPRFFNAITVAISPPKKKGKDILSILEEDQDSVEYVVQDEEVPFNAAEFIRQTSAPLALARLSSQDPRLRQSPPFIYEYHSSAGTGVKIYVVDSGINLDHEQWADETDPSSSGKSRARCGFSVEFDDPLCEDRLGHGTAVASAAAGITLGPAKKAEIISVKVVNSKITTFSYVLAGLNYVFVTEKDTGSSRPSIVNLSLGSTQRSGIDALPLWGEVIRTLTDAGIHVVRSAGNEGIEIDDRWLKGAPILTTGYLTETEQKSPLSNWGLGVNFWEIGENVEVASIVDRTSRLRLGGSSFSAPLVAGVAAVTLSAYGQMSPQDLIDTLTVSAYRIDDPKYGTLLVPQVPV
ncbi:subtilisin-like serine protease [Tulasnella sp. 403]|nr:subtilisin-like serine protease [Tulasnella sp. 403]